MRRTNDPDQREFTRFVKETEPRLSYALAAAYGVDTGAEATADAPGDARRLGRRSSQQAMIGQDVCLVR
jgi:hypothetical protein